MIVTKPSQITFSCSLHQYGNHNFILGQCKHAVVGDMSQSIG